MSDSEHSSNSQVSTPCGIDGCDGGDNNDLDLLGQIDNTDALDDRHVEGGDDDGDNDSIVPFNIPRNVAPVHEIEEMVRILNADSGDTKSQKVQRDCLVQNLFRLICGQACNNITEESNPDKKLALYELAALEFTQTMETYPKKEYAMNNLMHFLPDKKFPDEFITFIETMQSVVPPPAFWGKKTKSALEKSIEEQRFTFFGSKVWETHLSAKGFVNNHLNPHWKTAVLDKSGNNASAVYLGIRQHLWAQSIRDKAVKSVREREKYTAKLLKEGMSPKTPVICRSEEDREAYILESVNKIEEAGFEADKYPKSWMSFVLLGKPADTRMLKSYSSGVLDSKKRSLSLADMGQLGSRLSKQSRKFLSKGSSSSNKDNSSSGSGNDKGKSIQTLKIEFAAREKKPPVVKPEDVHNSLVLNMEKRIANLEKLIERGIKPEANNILLDRVLEEMEIVLARATRVPEEDDAQITQTPFVALPFDTPT